MQIPNDIDVKGYRVLVELLPLENAGAIIVPEGAGQDSDGAAIFRVLKLGQPGRLQDGTVAEFNCAVDDIVIIQSSISAPMPLTPAWEFGNRMLFIIRAESVAAVLRHWQRGTPPLRIETPKQMLAAAAMQGMKVAN